MQFVKQLLDRDNTVHATARAPKESQGLQELLKQYNGKLSTNKTSLDTASSQSINAWAQELVEGKTAAFDVSLFSLPWRWRSSRTNFILPSLCVFLEQIRI